MQRHLPKADKGFHLRGLVHLAQPSRYLLKHCPPPMPGNRQRRRTDYQIPPDPPQSSGVLIPQPAPLYPPFHGAGCFCFYLNARERLGIAAACALAMIRGKRFNVSSSGKSADFPELPFHGRGRNGKQHLQRRFLRKRGAAGGRLLPLGGAVAQRLRGFESAEPEKTVKRSSRRTGVNLQFFPV